MEVNFNFPEFDDDGLEGSFTEGTGGFAESLEEEQSSKKFLLGPCPRPQGPGASPVGWERGCHRLREGLSVW